MANWRKTLTNEHRLEKGKGGGGGGGTSISPEIVSMAQKGTFKPFTITTSGGTGFGTEGAFGATASPEYQAIQQGALAGTQQLLPSVAGAFGERPSEFDYGTGIGELRQQAYQKALGTEFGGFSNADINALQSAAVSSALQPSEGFKAPEFDLAGRTSDIYQQQAALLQPQFEQQQNQLANTLFGSGRLGLSLAGSAVGAGGQGMVNPDAFGLARAQSQTLADVASQSRQAATAEQAQQYGQALNTFGANQEARRQYELGLSGLGNQLFGQQLQGFGAQSGQAQNLAQLGSTLGQQDLSKYTTNLGALDQYQRNLLAGTTGLFGLGTGVSDMELALLSGGLTGEQVRGASYTDAAAALASGMEQQQSGGGKGSIGDLATAAASVYATANGIPAV